MKENNKKMIPKGYANEDTDKRLDWLSDKIGFNYDTDLSTTPEDLKGIIENHIGFMKIPMAVAGPLKIEGKYANGEYYVPICTLEGTLALSMTRGMIATHRCDGIRVSHIKQELSRAPVFTFDNLKLTYGGRTFEIGKDVALNLEAESQRGK